MAAKKKAPRKTAKKGPARKKATAKKAPKRRAPKSMLGSASSQAPKKASRKSANNPFNNMVDNWFQSLGFTDVIEWEGKNSTGMTPLIESPYHSKSRDIEEACADKKKGFYTRVWRTNAEGRNEICLKP